MVSDNFFQGLEVTPLLGRAFFPDDDRPGIERWSSSAIACGSSSSARVLTSSTSRSGSTAR